MLLQTKPGLVVTVDADGLRMEHPAWDYAVRTSSAVMDILYRARTPVETAELGVGKTGGAAVDRLVEMDVLQSAPRDAHGPTQQVLPTPWNYWGAATWLFHNRAHRTRFLHDETDIWLEKVSRPEPRPERTARYTATAHNAEFELADHHGRSAVADLFAARRTRREFSGGPLSAAAVGELVSETFRVRGTIDADYFGTLPLKSYPSSGGRHEIDVYIAVRNVSGLRRGFYYYDDYRDSLVDTGIDFGEEELDMCLAHQGMVHASAAVLVAVCAAERLAWKYRDPRGYLDAYTNAGHAMQNAALYAESLGIGAWITTAVNTDAMSTLMRLRGDEFPLAAMALGQPPAEHGVAAP